MNERIDAHIHLFEAGYQNRSLSQRIGVDADEADYYMTLAREHGGGKALVVGYAAEPWCRDNNRYLAQLARRHDWIHPVAYVDRLDQLDIDTLQRRQQEAFVGISFYQYESVRHEQLSRVPPAVWRWLETNRWLISINGNDGAWRAWTPVLQAYPALRVLISHLGLSEGLALATDADAAASQLHAVLALAAFPETRVKLSGFYVLGAALPHRCAWPYIAAAMNAYGPDRLLWGSDYSPHLDFVSFADTINVVAEAPCLDDDARRQVFAANLQHLLTEAHPV